MCLTSVVSILPTVLLGVLKGEAPIVTFIQSATDQSIAPAGTVPNRRKSAAAGPPEAEASGDPLLLRATLPFAEEYFPLGFRVRLSTNSDDILSAAEESWSCFSNRLSSFGNLQLRIGLTDKTSESCPPAPVFRAHGNLFSIIADQDNFITCDLERGTAFGWFSRGAVHHSSYFRYHFLEAAVWSLLCGVRVIPLHAACIESAGHGVLLCGDSGAGKSSLSYACARAGWTFITDDATYLRIGDSTRRVMGNPYRVRFRPTAAELFPELAGLSITPRAAGKPSIELPTRTLPHLRTAEECRIDAIVFLNRHHPFPPALLPFPHATALRWLNQSIENTGGPREKQIATLQNLMGARIYELRYQDLSWAIGRLDSLAREGR
jgi:hypothetical protein